MSSTGKYCELDIGGKRNKRENGKYGGKNAKAGKREKRGKMRKAGNLKYAKSVK